LSTGLAAVVPINPSGLPEAMRLFAESRLLPAAKTVAEKSRQKNNPDNFWVKEYSIGYKALVW
jgi:hypothetical protein